MFPPWLTVVLLVALLGYSGKRTLTKGIKRWKGEDKQSPRPTLEEAALWGTATKETSAGEANDPPQIRLTRRSGAINADAFAPVCARPGARAGHRAPRGLPGARMVRNQSPAIPALRRF